MALTYCVDNGRFPQACVPDEMLHNHAENQWVIGTVGGALQPIVMRNGLRGLPEKALYSWEPTSMIGIYRPDEIHWNKAAGKEARR